MSPSVPERDILDRAKTPDGGTITLLREQGELVIRVDGLGLMSSRVHGSERAMACAGCENLASQARARVLVGGLGLGYTLRAVLDRLDATAEVVCVELMDAIVKWHHGKVGELASRPLDDPRVHLVIGDVIPWVTTVAKEHRETLDAILLDVDNGPIPLTSVGNFWLYAQEGLDALMAALKPGGTVVFWSAMEDERFAARMRAAGFVTEIRRVDPKTGRRARRVRPRARPRHPTHHVLFVGKKPIPKRLLTQRASS